CLWVGPDGFHCDDFFRGYQLSAHIREAHGVQGSDKDYVTCKWRSCNRKLNKEHLLRHMESHLGIAYSCDTCRSAFSRRATLNRHKKTCFRP
ncbi:hypothetical protein CY34DRAFT_93300, partial [Suillus luteus UH-Slu-Lm8-n1]